MTVAGEKLLAGAREALAVARGELPAARIWHQGIAYVPEDRWEDMTTAPTTGESFLAALSNGWVITMSGHSGIADGWAYQWWRADHLSIPYEPSHPSDTNWSETHTLRAVAWQPLPSPPHPYSSSEEA